MFSIPLFITILVLYHSQMMGLLHLTDCINVIDFYPFTFVDCIVTQTFKLFFMAWFYNLRLKISIQIVEPYTCMDSILPTNTSESILLFEKI